MNFPPVTDSPPGTVVTGVTGEAVLDCTLTTHRLLPCVMPHPMQGRNQSDMRAVEGPGGGITAAAGGWGQQRQWRMADPLGSQPPQSGASA